MAASFDMAAANFALKELYDGQVPTDLVYKNNPLLTLMPKDTGFGGEYKPIPVISSPSMGRSVTFANAQGNQTALQGQKFLLTSKSDYSIATIDNRTLMSMREDKMAFLRGAKTVIDGAFEAATLSLASALYRSGTGSIAQVSTSTGLSTGVITLQDPNSATQFEYGMTLQAAATDGGTPRAALGYVISVDRTGGTITVSAVAQGGVPGSPSGWTTSDFLLVQGDSNGKISGLAAWVTSTTPTSTDNFYGVNRSPDPTRLAGVRYPGSNQPIDEAIIGATALVAREGGMPDYFFCNFASWTALQWSLGSKVRYEDVAGPAGIMFESIVINGPQGKIKVIADRNCPGYTGYLLQMNTWTLDTLGNAPQVIPYPDGIQILRVGNSDAAEVRVGMYGNVECRAPGKNAYVALSQ